MRKLLPILFLLVASACSSGPAAPSIEATQQVCNDLFCVDVPEGWVPEIGDTYIAFNHRIDPDNTFLTVGTLDMEAVVENAGGTWPVPPEEVTAAFWALLDDAEVGSFERSARQVGGAIKSWGNHSDGDMWHLLYPVDGSRGIAIELRAPNDSWETHADQVFTSLEVLKAES
ncbi:MAG: hypothetical protein ABFR95_10230 [Actinomycetota bacterium]